MAVLPLLAGNGVSSPAGKGVVSAGAQKALAGAPAQSSTGALPQPSPAGTTAPSSTPINADDMDTLRLAGKLLPGVWTIEPSDVGPKLTKRGSDAKGRTGAKIDADGLKLVQLSITGRFWEVDQLDTVKSLLVPIVRPKNPKSIAPVAIDCWITRIYAIASVVIEDAPGPKHEGKGVYSWTIKASEFRPPVSAGGAGGSVGLNAKTKSLTQQQALNQILEMNLALANRAANILNNNSNIGTNSAFLARVTAGLAPPSATVPPP